MRGGDRPRTARAITGSGHYLDECLDLPHQPPDVHLSLSRAGGGVTQPWGRGVPVFPQRSRACRDSTAGAPPVSLCYEEVCSQVVVAPVTANTMARMVCGISDTLVTNRFAQGRKCRAPSMVFAGDAAPEVDTDAPGGMVKVYGRGIDPQNTEALMGFEYDHVVTDPAGLAATHSTYLECPSTSSSSPAPSPSRA